MATNKTPRRKTSKETRGFFDRFDQLEDDQFLSLRKHVNDYYGSNFVEEETDDDDNSETKDRSGSGGSGSDGGWIAKFFGDE